MAGRRGADAPKPLQEVLSELSAHQRLINQLDDEVSAAIRNVEQLLRIHVATKVSVVVERYEDGDVMLLSFGKHDGKWGLIVEVGDPDPEGAEYTKTMLLASSREVRARAFSESHVEKLIREAHTAIEIQIVGRRQALANASSIIAALGDGPPAEIDEAEAFGATSDPDDLPF